MTRDMTTPDETIAVPGLSAPASIHIDRWGIPHLRAETRADLFFLQGFNAARDRLWQIDLWRKRGLGLLAADFGPGYLAQDMASRLFLYRGDMAAEWVSYADDTQDICTAFVGGINAYIDRVARGAAPLPVEFAEFGTRPAPWAPEDVVRIRSHSLTRNANAEVARSRITAYGRPDLDALRAMLEPAVDLAEEARLPGVDLPPHVLNTFNLATAAVFFSPERLSAGLEEAYRWASVSSITPADEPTELTGSNNWAIHGSRTQSGRPILASDPHRDHMVPSIRYIVHLTAPGIDAIGAGEAAAPGISIGHNGHSAFAVTIFSADQEDLYVYETKPGDPASYSYGEGWEAMTLVEETFAVAGHADQRRVAKFTRHGPVVFEDPERRLAVAVRTVWSEPGSAAYLASLSSMFAKDLDTFREAMARWGTPSVNQVYADAGNTIAWMPVGHMPIRPNWKGIYPVPGSGEYEWAGRVEQAQLPLIVNPASGFVFSANQMNLPADWPHETLPIGFEWYERSRAARIEGVLSEHARHSIATCCALQTDTFSIPASRLKPLYHLIRSDDPHVRAAQDELARWDLRTDPQSTGAAIFEVWWKRHLLPGVLAHFAPSADLLDLLRPGNAESVLALLTASGAAPAASWGDLSTAERDALVGRTFAEAVETCRALMGDDVAQWRWGRLHHALFAHALRPVLKQRQRELDVGPLEKGGSDSTVMLASYASESFRVNLGASVRLVIDVGDWDKSCCINTPGQSGDPASPHYRDLASTWARGGYVPLSFSAAAVDAAVERVIRLSAA